MVINSLGDVYVLVQITATAVEKLATARHAPKEVGELIKDAHTFKACISEAHTTIHDNGDVLKPHDGIKRSMVWLLKRCEETAGDTQKTALSYEDIVKKEGEGTGADVIRSQWMRAPKTGYQRIKWTTMDEAVKELRTQLAQHIQALALMNQLLLSRQMAQMYEFMRPMGEKVDHIFRHISHTASSTSQPRLINPDSQSSLSQTPPLSPDALSQKATPTVSPLGPTGSQDIPPSDGAIHEQASPPIDRWLLPPPSLDISSYNFPHDLDLGLPCSFPKGTHGDEFAYVKLASNREQQDFINELTNSRDFVEIDVDSVDFVFQMSPTSDAAVISACDVGKVLLLKKHGAVEDIWTLNTARTIRFRQRVPIWDDIIPYSINGEESAAVVEQGSGLSFVTFENGSRVFHSIPTTWVTYRFANAENCRRFQEHLYGWDLVLIVPVREIYRPHRIRGDERLVGYQNVRVWKNRSGPETRFMARLIKKRGRRRYLEFDFCQESVRMEPKAKAKQSKLAVCGVNAILEDPVFERRQSTATLSSISEASSPSSIKRRFSWNHPEVLDEIIVLFEEQKHLNDLLELALRCQRPVRSQSWESNLDQKFG